MDKFLATILGVFLGVLASIPTALVIAALSRTTNAWPDDPETTKRDITVIDAEWR